MRNLATPSPRRTGFTLIELLVAIAIIGILIGLLVPVVMVGNGTCPALTTTNELSNLDTAIQLFKTTYGVDYLPSQIKLCEQCSGYDLTQPLDKASVDFLTRVWPNLLRPDVSGNVPWMSSGIDWNANGAIDPPMILEGHQCLVFFLGGAQQRAPVFACLGFSSDPLDPIKLSQSQGRKGPFFEFPTARLGICPGNAAGANGLYLSFFNSYTQNSPPQFTGNPGDKPYAYFSNYGQRNGFNDPVNKKFPNADCASLGVNPYYQGGVKGPQYLGGNTHQIISAGMDRKFGPGGLWDKTKTPPLALDDQTNFSGGALLSGWQ